MPDEQVDIRMPGMTTKGITKRELESVRSDHAEDGIVRSSFVDNYVFTSETVSPDHIGCCRRDAKDDVLRAEILG